ncbi:MAG: hypothetical protein JW984_12735 [Deltaproteobacteria bacterium]|uniref:DUF4412 domain-containing protein n=1 Tax=Candidatus Zymogenus saltonus TaxID=2844893 RepID=A0A9D8PP77_9DELT|nr:hypothetical protein [Candidatus Zymogenus saltonus]
MFRNKSKTGLLKRDAEGAPAGALVLSAIFILILFSFVSCSGGGEKVEDTAGSPGTETGLTPETGEGSTGNIDDMVDVGVLKGEELSGLRLTAKTRLTYLVNGAVEEAEEGFVAIDGNKTRYETPKCGELGYSHVTVDRGDLKLTFVLIPERRRYFEIKRETGNERNKDNAGDYSSSGKTPSGQSLIFGGTLEPFGPSANEVSRKSLGVEEVRGYACEKFRVKEEFLDGSFTRYTEWLAADLNHLPIKTEYRLKAGSDLYITRWELIDIKMGAPSPDLFNVPDGYVRVNNISEALKEVAP